MTDSNNIYIKAFEEYRTMGLDPVPIPYRNGLPFKGPTETDWQQKAADHQYTVKDFAGPCNIGILLGGPKNVTDIDCDSTEAVLVASELMQQFLNQRGAQTMIFGHDSKRQSHYVFYCDQSLPSEILNDPSDHERIIEYRCLNVKEGGRGWQTVFPPSLWRNKKNGDIEEIRFEQDSTSEPLLVEAAELRKLFQDIAGIALLGKHFPAESGRHETILALSGTLARLEVEVERAVEIVGLAYRYSIGYNGDVEKAIIDVRSVYTTFDKEQSAHLFGYPRLTEMMPKSVVDEALVLLGVKHADHRSSTGGELGLERNKPDQRNYNLTDAGNGLRLVDKHEGEIRFCVDDHNWYIWDGVRWRKDSVRKIRELAKQIADDIRNEVAAMKPPTPTGEGERDKEALARHEFRRRELSRWANQTENTDRVSKTILSAESDARITCFRADFDRHAHLLNCENCIVNLYTGDTMPHERRLMLSNLCPSEYESNATHPVWNESVVAFTRNHPDLPAFLKRVAGYSIQGDKSEERILLLYGPGNAGKGTFMDWLTSALGPDYACAMDANSVLKQKRDSAAASGDIARLEGKRIVVVSEIEKGSRVQESFMKQASGNDALVARGLYQSEREFRPTHQFWFQTNYRPGFDSTDSGNKRRYIEIPFDNDLSADPLVKFDSKLKIRMCQDVEFLKAVLAWCVEGCIEWRKNGLDIPESVKAATAGLFAHNDFLSTFLSEMCVVEANGKVSVKELSDVYNYWCDCQGEEPAQGRTFNRMMEERGFERKQVRLNGASGKAWTGIRLRNEGFPPADISAPRTHVRIFSPISAASERLAKVG